MLRTLVWFSLFSASAAFAQNWEVGALGGFGFTNDLTYKSGSASATAGLTNSGAVGAFGGEDTFNYVSGEARYLYDFSDLRLSGPGASTTFAAHTHILEGVFLFHFTPRTSRVRPFIAAGGGLSVLVGTGMQLAAQPLGNFAGLTATNQVLPVADVGAGVKIDLQKHLRLRFEVDDYMTGAPTKVIAPYPGVTVSGFLNNIVAFGALSVTF